MKIRQEINILVSAYSATAAVISTSEIAWLDTTRYSGAVTYYLEVEGTATAGSAGSVRLRRLNTTTDDATFTTSNLGTSDTLYRVALTPRAATQTYYFLYVDSGGSGKTVAIKAARIVVLQDEGTGRAISATETHIELGSKSTISSTSAVQLSSPKYWKYTAANWSPTPTALFEVVTSSPTTKSYSYLSLQKDNGSWAGWTSVSDIAINWTSLNLVRQTISAANLVDGCHYRVVGYAASSKSPLTVYNAKIILRQATSLFTERQPLVRDIYRGYGGLVISSDGTIMGANRSDQTGPLRSTNGGANWSVLAPDGGASSQWGHCAMSADGQVLFYGRNQLEGGDFFLSTNGGTSWTTISPYNAGNEPYICRISPDGQKLLAVSRAEQSSLWYRIFRSVNQGQSWTDITPTGLTGYWTAFCDDDIETILAYNFNGATVGLVYVSTDGGATWPTTHTFGVYLANSDTGGMAVSGDGQHMMVAARDSGNVWVSNDQGATWDIVYPYGDATTHLWRAMACGPTSQMVVLPNDGVIEGIHYSQDGGSTWSHLPDPPPAGGYRYYYEVALSRDCNHMLISGGIGGNNPYLWTYAAADTGVFEPQYLIANTTLASGTGQQWLTSWNTTEWADCSTEFTHAADSVASSSSVVQLEEAGGPTLAAANFTSNKIKTGPVANDDTYVYQVAHTFDGLGYANPGIVLRMVKSSAFTTPEYLSLPNNCAVPYALVDGGANYLYFATAAGYYNQPLQLGRIHKSDWATVNLLGVAQAITNLTVDTAGTYLLGASNSAKLVRRVRLDDFSTTDTIALPSGITITGIENDANYVYISGAISGQGVILRLHKSDYSTIDTYTFSSLTNIIGVLVDGAYVYGIAPHGSVSAFIRIHSDFTTVDIVDLPRAGNVTLPAQNATYVLVEIDPLGSRYWERIAKADFQTVTETSLSYYGAGTITADASYLYSGGNTKEALDATTFATLSRLPVPKAPLTGSVITSPAYQGTAGPVTMPATTEIATRSPTNNNDLYSSRLICRAEFVAAISIAAQPEGVESPGSPGTLLIHADGTIFPAGAEMVGEVGSPGVATGLVAQGEIGAEIRWSAWLCTSGGVGTTLAWVVEAVTNLAVSGDIASEWDWSFGAPLTVGGAIQAELTWLANVGIVMSLVGLNATAIIWSFASTAEKDLTVSGNISAFLNWVELLNGVGSGTVVNLEASDDIHATVTWSFEPRGTPPSGEPIVTLPGQNYVF